MKAHDFVVSPRLRIVLSALLATILAASGAALAADSGTLIVLNKSDHTASLIDLESKAVKATLPTGKFPHEVAVSPEGNRAVIANYGNQGEPGSSLTVLDIPGRKTRIVDLGSFRRPHGIVWLAASRVAVTVEGSRALLIVDIETGKIDKAIDTAQDVSHMVAVASRAERAFVANIGSGSVTAIDLKSGKKLAHVATGAGAEGIDVSPDGREVWVTNGRADNVSVIDVATLRVVATLPSKQLPIRAKFTSDGKWVLVSNAASGDLAVFDAATKQEVARIPMRFADGEAARDGTGPVPVGVLVAPQVQRAYVANTNADIVSVVDLAKRQVVDRITAGNEPDGLGYSPLNLN